MLIYGILLSLLQLFRRSDKSGVVKPILNVVKENNQSLKKIISRLTRSRMLMLQLRKIFDKFSVFR